jgi:hypothetical protein
MSGVSQMPGMIGRLPGMVSQIQRANPQLRMSGYRR